MAHSDRTTSNLIESLARNLCRDRAILDCTRVERLDHFTAAAAEGGFDLIIAGVSNLLLRTAYWNTEASVCEAMAALRTVRALSQTPILAVGVPEADQWAVTQAGADIVMDTINCAELIREIKRSSAIFSPSPASSPSNDFGQFWRRATLRVGNALGLEKVSFPFSSDSE
ncbi:MAG TPA: hypothetical protein VHH88_11270 [Verrucomicrobiae bacterium]|nr:hypothetical protein [Verrucomicrobiae bacterium]